MEELSLAMLLGTLLFSVLCVTFALYGLGIASFFGGGALGCALLALFFACFDD